MLEISPIKIIILLMIKESILLIKDLYVPIKAVELSSVNNAKEFLITLVKIVGSLNKVKNPQFSLR